MAANLGQKSIVNTDLSLYVDAANPYSAKIVNNLTVGKGFTNLAAADNSVGHQKVAGGSSYFVTINSQGSTNRIAYSTDGITWTGQAAVQANWWFDICYGNGKFVAVARQTGSNAGTTLIQYASESDLTSWTGVTPAENIFWNLVTYGNGKFVAVAGNGTNQITYASDSNLNSWSTASSAENNDWRGLCYGGGKFVAVARDGTNRIMYADDSDVTDWTAVSAPQANEWYGVAYGDGYYVATAKTGTNRVMYSTNASNWTLISASNIPYAGEWNDIIFADGYFVAINGQNTSEGTTTGTAVMWAKSSDLNTWTLSSVGEAGTYTGIGYKDGKFVICSWDTTNKLAYADTLSPNNWNDLSLNKRKGTIVDFPIYSSNNGGTFNFDGTDDYINCGNFLSLTSYTKSVWFRPEAATNNLFSGTGGHALWMQNTNNSLRAGHNGTWDRVSYTLPSGNMLNQWWNGTVTWNNSTGWVLYLNGDQVDTDSDTTAPSGGVSAVDTIAGYGASYYFDGDIAQVLVYDRVLSAAEVLQNYNATKERFGL